MKGKTIVCVFAHPDDEAFGPSGTITTLSAENDVYILCATKGEAGLDSTVATEKLAHRREEELRKSAKLLGVKNVYFLGFKDGTLSNSKYHSLAEKIEKKLKELQPEIVLTFEPKGISGHIDHVTVSLVTTFVFHKLSFIKELWYYCILEEKSKVLGKDYFIYFPKGYTRRQVDKTFDIANVWNKKVEAMYIHKSQKHDAERILKRTRYFPKEEHFIVIKK